jgi:hypothetical protein
MRKTNSTGWTKAREEGWTRAFGAEIKPPPRPRPRSHFESQVMSYVSRGWITPDRALELLSAPRS